VSYRSCLYHGQVFHRRVKPRQHTLRYRVFSLLLDIDELPTLDKDLWLFSHNRWNLFGFHDQDVGDGSDASLHEYVSRLLRQAGLQQTPARVLLSCYPRVLGYAFNPLSLFYCLDDTDQVFAVVHEVHNTFGERHAYVLPVSSNPSGTDPVWIHQSADKALFVSPFADMHMHYKFRLNLPAAKQVVAIRVFDEAGFVLSASYVANRQLLSATNLLQRFLSIPLMTFKVIVGIHWEALRLWMKRVPWFSHQPKHKPIV